MYARGSANFTQGRTAVLFNKEGLNNVDSGLPPLKGWGRQLGQPVRHWNGHLTCPDNTRDYLYPLWRCNTNMIKHRLISASAKERETHTIRKDTGVRSC